MHKQRSNQMIECLRFLGCVFVVFIHCPFPDPVGEYVKTAGRTAVPFFLLLSGYFSDNAEPVKKAKKKLLDTLIVVLAAGALCLLWNSVNSYLRWQDFFKWVLPYLKRETALNFLLYNRAVFFNSTFYYFFALIYTYCIFILACKTKTTKLFYCLIPFLLVMLFVAATNGKWYMGGNWLFLGIPFFFLGHFLHSHPAVIRRMKGKELPLILLGLLLAWLEQDLQLHTDYLYIGSVISAVACLCLCVNSGERACPRPLVYLGTNCSLFIMVLHCEVRDTLALFLPKQSYSFPLLVLGITIVLSAAASTLFSLMPSRSR